MSTVVTNVWIAVIAALVAVALFLGVFLSYFKISQSKGRYSPFTEDALRLPGHSLRIAREKLLTGIGESYVVLIGVSILAAFSAYFLSGIVLVALVTICAAGMLYVLSKLWKRIEEIQRYSLGLEGEEYTGSELNLLMEDRAVVFHDLPYAHGNIDHIVIGRGAVLAVETKAVRKPQSKSGNRSSRVEFDGEYLVFPHGKYNKPVLQAKQHAKHLREVFKVKLGVEIQVFAVVALPGWYIDVKSKSKDVLVVNPKRGNALRKWLGNIHDESERGRVVEYVDSVARSVPHRSDRLDPNASDKYDFWLNPRPRENRL